MVNDIKQFVRKNILELAPYASAREEYSGKKGVFLDANENPYGMYNRYPDPYQELLKQRLAELKELATDYIFVGNGSDEVIDIAFRVFCEPYRDKAITFSPTYGMYGVSAQINGVELITLPLNQAFQMDRSLLLPYLDDEKVKLIFLCSPNNPTGNLLASKDIDFVLENFKGIVVLDEAYIDFSEYPSYLQKVQQYANLIVCQTLSKAWGLAGVRLGTAYMSKEILFYYNKVKAPYNVSVLNQQAGLKALQNVDGFRAFKAEIMKNKVALYHALVKQPVVKKIYPSDTNFFLVEVIDANEIYQQLIEQQIIIRNRNSVVPGCIRITVGTQEENEQLISALENIAKAKQL